MVHILPSAVFFVLTAFTLPINSRRSTTRHNPHHEEVDDSFNEILQREEDTRLVLLHHKRVAPATECDQPKPQVIHVSDHYPGKMYLPHCTVLHRCGKHSGCCAVETFKCVAAEREKVTLYFYSIPLDGESTARQLEKLVFTNHTRCACALDDTKHF